jgi:hypothetical protein
MSDETNKPDPPESATPPRVVGSERVIPAADHAPYDLAPHEDHASTIPDPAPWTRDPSSSRPFKSGPAAGKVGSGRFIDTLPDDADLTDIGADPRADPRSTSTDPNDDTALDESPGVTEPFVKEGMGNPQLIVGVGLGLTIVAAILAGANVADSGAWWASSLLAVFFTLCFAACGVVAVGVAAHLAGLTIGRLDLAGARMFLLSALVMALSSIRIDPLGLLAGPVIVLLVLAGYWLGASLLFRQGPRRTLSLAASHFALSLTLWIVLQAYSLVQSASTSGVRVPQ